MSRYIDVNMLIKKYIDTDIKKFSNSDVKIVLENLKQNILKAPSIDIVFCKECKHRYDDGWREPRWACDYLQDMRLKDDNFCSYGERSEE